MPFKFECNSNFDNILLKNVNVVFQPVWQPYLQGRHCVESGAGEDKNVSD